MKAIPICTIRLLDVTINDEPDYKKMLLIGAFEKVQNSLKGEKVEGIEPELFHNQENKYSGIQLAAYKKTAEYTAIGETEVATLNFWYEQYLKSTGEAPQNIVLINETYVPAFIAYQQTYRVKTMLISDELAKELNNMTDKFARWDRLEKYLYGNLKRFMRHIGYEPGEQFLKVTIQDIMHYDTSKPVYHGQKKTALDIRFQCNFRLPQTLRLGQSTAIGYGRVS
ncbi:CRISPR-associated endonuclease Cas6 [Arcticibacterium luteifluviistationis]|uniref:Cas6b C-terminal domain-containing protein n=1 Tax=Arcticibacterium luteifluviistationis TaxID=1784714 RepID=A0A2Z4G8X9_9BACT|nr:CRISPR-associated endonuclease Cas6 [Arcticibacterium luteifluviistationis]AWV97677.1 hypothetical protein DJ013_05660 [Arcticibacterium luteifluviistationis]